MKSIGAPYQPHAVTLITAVYIPELAGYWEESLSVLDVCLQSAVANTPQPFDLLVIDNGSCPEVREFLRLHHERDEIQYLVLSRHNMGKVGAWNLAMRAAPGEYLAYFDCDVLFRPNWLQASLAVLQTFPRAGMVTARPAKFLSKPPHERDSAGFAYAKSPPKGVDVQRGELIPSQLIQEHFRGLGTETTDRGYPEEEVRISKGGISAYICASHFQFVTTRDIAEQILPLPVTTHPLGDDYLWDTRLNGLGHLRLSTEQAYVHHLGNSLQGEPVKAFGGDKLTKERTSAGRLARSLARGAFKRPLRLLQRQLANFLDGPI